MKIIGKIFDFIIWVLFGFIVFLFSILLYIKYLWPSADYEQIISTIRDTQLRIIFNNMVYYDFIFGFLFFVIVFPFCYFCLDRKKVIGLGVIFGLLGAYISGFIHYQIYSRMNTTLYEEEYVNPETIKYNFPKNKRNLLLIYMESFENGFDDVKNYEANLIPNLKKLQGEGEFSSEHYVLPGSNYSIAALVASMCAIPLKYTNKRTIWDTMFFLDNTTCFPEVLKENGYQTVMLKAADITFTNADIFSLRHGYSEALGVDEIKKNFFKDNNNAYMGTFGGVSDRTLFEYAKVKISEFDEDRPFFLTLFSLDTHMPGYYLDKKCEEVFGDLRDAYLCSDKGVYEFIEWFKSTKYYDNTTVVIVGDHNLSYKLKGKAKAKHGIYNVFLNTAENLKIDDNKIFSTYDLAPTILEAVGVDLKPRAFGLGRSLFSDEKTLIEKKGVLKFKLELMKKSKFYSNFEKIKKAEISKYKLYKIGDEIVEKEFLLYTNASGELLNRVYIDKMNIELDGYKGGDLEVEMEFFAIVGFDNTLDIFVNNDKIYNYEMPKKKIQPLSYKFVIKKDRIKNNKFQLGFHNNAGTNSAVNIGVSIKSMKILEK